MTKMESPTVPRSQSVFGFLVYWVTILAAIICILGPMVAFIDLDANVINPHYEMSNIFDGMKPNFDLQDLQDDAAAGTNLLVVEDVELALGELQRGVVTAEARLTPSVTTQADPLVTTGQAIVVSAVTVGVDTPLQEEVGLEAIAQVFAALDGQA